MFFRTLVAGRAMYFDCGPWNTVEDEATGPPLVRSRWHLGLRTAGRHPFAEAFAPNLQLRTLPRKTRLARPRGDDHGKRKFGSRSADQGRPISDLVVDQ